MPLFISFAAGIAFFYLSNYFPLTVLASLIPLTITLAQKKRLSWILVGLAAFLYASISTPPEIEPFICRDVIFEGYIKDLPQETDYGYTQTASLLDTGDCDAARAGMEATLFTPLPLGPRTTGIFLADIKGVYGYRNPHTLGKRLFVSAVLKSVRAANAGNTFMGHIRRARMQLIRLFQRSFSREVAGFLSAIIVGDRRNLPDGLRKSFTEAGLSHLLAISGTHFGIFSFLIFRGFRLVLKRLPYSVLNGMTLYITPSEASAILSLPFMTFYLLLSGAGIPAIRSFIMVNFFLFALLLGRKGAWKNSVSFAAAVLLFLFPEAVSDISFLLSFTAVTAIGFALEWKRKGAEDIFPFEERRSLMEKAKHWGGNVLIITAAAYTVTLPLALYFFHVVSTVSLMTNMVIAPFICFVILPMGVISSLIYVVADFFPFAVILQYLSQGVIDAIAYIADIPYAGLSMPAFPAILLVLFYAGLCGGVILRKARGYGAALSLLCVLMMVVYPYVNDKSNLEVTFLDVGQAESSVIILPDKKVVVIDTGRDGKQTVGYLDYLGVDRIDALILSHAGSDHTGGFDYIAGRKEIKMVIDNGKTIHPYPLTRGPSYIAAKRGDIMEGPGYRIEILHPYEGFYTAGGSIASEENNQSVVCRITANGIVFLFTGDIEAEAETDLVSLGNYLRCDVLKVPHHGSRTSSSEEFVAAASPSVAVISSGMFNPYGHPHEQTKGRLHGINTFTTARHGAIKITARAVSDIQGERIPIVTAKTFEQYRLKVAQNVYDELENLKKLFITW